MAASHQSGLKQRHCRAMMDPVAKFTSVKAAFEIRVPTPIYRGFSEHAIYIRKVIRDAREREAQFHSVQAPRQGRTTSSSNRCRSVRRAVDLSTV